MKKTSSDPDCPRSFHILSIVILMVQCMQQGRVLRRVSRAGAPGPGCALGSAIPRVPLQAAPSGPAAPRLPGSCPLPATP